MGSTAQLYNLGWSEFDSSLKGAVKNLRSNGDLVDVTLVAGGRTFPAHKLVISAASPLLLELLKVTPCQHPVILLAGISAVDMDSLLEFVYSGEVSVHPSQLPSLLQAANILNIFGLVQGTITAEEPEIQRAATAALEVSDQKLNIASLAAATNAGLVAASHSRKRKANREELDNADSNEKWCDLSDDSSDSETCTKTLRSGHMLGGSNTSVTQTIQQVVQTNNSSIVESILKPQKSSSLLTSVSVNSASSASGLTKSTMVKLGTSSLAGLPSDSDSAVVPSHLLHLHAHGDNQDDNNAHSGDESYASIVAAADAAALAASTLADKKGISEQPAACPLCNAIIRQSRNLRRHLELKHFGKRPKKGKGNKRTPILKQCDTDTESNAGSVADTTVIEHVQVEMKSPSPASVCGSGVVPPAGASSPAAKHHTLTELQPAHQHQNVEAFLQQQQQLQQLQLDTFPHHMAPPTSNSSYQIPYPHPHPHLSVLRGDPHASLIGSDSITFRSHPSTPQTFSALYTESSRSSSHQ